MQRKYMNYPNQSESCTSAYTAKKTIREQNRFNHNPYLFFEAPRNFKIRKYIPDEFEKIKKEMEKKGAYVPKEVEDTFELAYSDSRRAEKKKAEAREFFVEEYGGRDLGRMHSTLNSGRNFVYDTDAKFRIWPITLVVNASNILGIIFASVYEDAHKPSEPAYHAAVIENKTCPQNLTAYENSTILLGNSTAVNNTIAADLKNNLTYFQILPSANFTKQDMNLTNLNREDIGILENYIDNINQTNRTKAEEYLLFEIKSFVREDEHVKFSRAIELNLSNKDDMENFKNLSKGDYIKFRLSGKNIDVKSLTKISSDEYNATAKEWPDWKNKKDEIDKNGLIIHLSTIGGAGLAVAGFYGIVKTKKKIAAAHRKARLERSLEDEEDDIGRLNKKLKKMNPYDKEYLAYSFEGRKEFENKVRKDKRRLTYLEERLENSKKEKKKEIKRKIDELEGNIESKRESYTKAEKEKLIEHLKERDEYFKEKRDDYKNTHRLRRDIRKNKKNNDEIKISMDFNECSGYAKKYIKSSSEADKKLGIELLKESCRKAKTNREKEKARDLVYILREQERNESIDCIDILIEKTKEDKVKLESFPVSACSKSVDKHLAYEWNNADEYCADKFIFLKEDGKLNEASEVLRDYFADTQKEIKNISERFRKTIYENTIYLYNSGKKNNNPSDIAFARQNFEVIRNSGKIDKELLKAFSEACN